MNAHVKKIVLAAGILITLMLIISGSGFVLRAARAQTGTDVPNQQVVSDQIRKVTVTGSAQVQVQPDTAIVSLGVETNADTASAALTQNNQQMQALIDALTSGGITREDIQTQTVQLYPRYNQPGDTQTVPAVVGYTAQNTVSLTIRDITQTGQVLDAAVSAGGNTINSIQFIVSDPTEALNTARVQAVENARQKAEQLAGLAESSLGPILEMIESPSPINPGIIVAGLQDTTRGAVPVEPGTQTVSLDLQVTWQLMNSGPSGSEPAGTQPSSGGQAGTGTATSSRLSITPIRGTPGSVVLVRGQGFPANSTVNLAVGRSATETANVTAVQADAQGSFSSQVTIPQTAEVNERWQVVATTGEGSQATAITSNTFTVSGP